MPWNLFIHIFDVGAGDSSLIIAYNPATQTGGNMLVDGGLNVCAQTVHDHVVALAGGLDTILVTHYDGDHSNGVVSLLAADNMSVMCEHIVAAGLAQPVPVGNRPQQIAFLTARFTAVAFGAVNDEADDPGDEGWGHARSSMNDATAAKSGFDVAKPANYTYTGPLLIPPPQTCKKAVTEAAVAAVNTAGQGPAAIQAAAQSAMFQALTGNLPDGGKFETGGFYRNTRVIDVGNATNPPANYVNAVTGWIKISSTTARVPGVNRQRISYPALGDELIWYGLPPDPTAPVAIVVSTPLNYIGAATGTAWQGPNPRATFGTDTAANRVSIGFVLQLGDFSYFSAGDLPAVGENLVGAALQQYPLPDGRGGMFPAALPYLVCLKCSHHGSDSATSVAFLGDIDPTIAMISCGARYDAPTQNVIDRIYARPNPAGFWLTNCQYQRIGIPFSQVPPLNQRTAPGNRSNVSGDNDVNNLQPFRSRGDILISLTETSATGAQGARRLWVQHWEECLMPPGPLVTTVDW